MLVDFVWNVFSKTGSIDSYVFMKEIEANEIETNEIEANEFEANQIEANQSNEAEQGVKQEAITLG